jgi:hypothetical protein
MKQAWLIPLTFQKSAYLQLKTAALLKKYNITQNHPLVNYLIRQP